MSIFHEFIRPQGIFNVQVRKESLVLTARVLPIRIIVRLLFWSPKWQALSFEFTS
jgi:hypothetical protein